MQKGIYETGWLYGDGQSPNYSRLSAKSRDQVMRLQNRFPATCSDAV